MSCIDIDLIVIEHQYDRTREGKYIVSVFIKYLSNCYKYVRFGTPLKNETWNYND